MSTPRRVFLIVLGISVLQSVFYYPQVPDQMASHFDGAGRPNGWMAKQAFFAVHLGVTGLLAFAFIYLPRSLRRWPSYNLPHKDYWLAPERREATQTYIHTQLLWFGVIAAVLMISAIQLAIEANFMTQPRLGPELKWILAGYFLYTAVWLGRFLLKFAKIPPQLSGGPGR